MTPVRSDTGLSREIQFPGTAIVLQDWRIKLAFLLLLFYEQGLGAIEIHELAAKKPTRT
jgi:hypothetical protein